MLNKVILQARLTKDVELKQTPSGTSVCSFSVANDTGFGDKKKANFINVVAWSKTAEHIAKYFFKGNMILITGRLETRDWTDKDGNKRYATEVIAEQVDFCGEKGQAEQAPQTDGFAPVGNDDTMPF